MVRTGNYDCTVARTIIYSIFHGLRQPPPYNGHYLPLHAESVSTETCKHGTYCYVDIPSDIDNLTENLELLIDGK